VDAGTSVCLPSAIRKRLGSVAEYLLYCTHPSKRRAVVRVACGADAHAASRAAHVAAPPSVILQVRCVLMLAPSERVKRPDAAHGTMTTMRQESPLRNTARRV